MPPKAKQPPKNKRAAATDASKAQEEEADPLWQNHPAKEVLRVAFWDGEIPLDWNRKPKTIYDKFKDHPAFKGMPYDATFQRRLGSLRDEVKDKISRKAMDQQAYDIFRKNFPVKQVNKVGTLRWHGSLAEQFLKADMLEGLHVEQKPEDFWATRPEYQEFPKDTFRKHIHQEKKLWKMHNFLEEKAIEDKVEAKKKAKQKAKREAAAMKKAMAKLGIDAKGKKKSTKKEASESSDDEVDDEVGELDFDLASASSSSSAGSTRRVGTI